MVDQAHLVRVGWVLTLSVMEIMQQGMEQAAAARLLVRLLCVLAVMDLLDVGLLISTVRV
jgi:hypothetical protein